MFPQKRPIAYAESKTYPLGEQSEQSPNIPAMALVALSHTPVEQQLYVAMLAAILETGEQTQTFTARRLMTLAGIRSLSTIRRALEGLMAKLSIQRKDKSHEGMREPGAAYQVYLPQEIIARRNAMGITHHFFFQAEDGIRDLYVTGVQTCALPI